MDPNVRRELEKLRDLIGGGGGASFNDAEGDPADIGTTADGSSTYAARRNHVHAHGNQLGGALHAAATNATAGFATAAQITTLEDLDYLTDCLSALPTNGVDDSANIQSRIDDAVTMGKKGLHFGEGSWTFDAGALTDDSCLIEVPSNFRITGAGWGRSILNIVNTSVAAGAGGVSVFRTESDARSVRFGPGLDFVGDNGTDPDGSDQTYVLNNENCCIDTWPGSIDTRDVTITGCIFRQTWGFAIHDRGGNFRTVVSECHFLQCNGGANTNSDYGNVSHCHFERSEGIEASGKYSVFGFNVLKDCYGVGLSIGGAVGGTEQPGCIVIGNTVDGGTGTGYVFSDAFSNSVVSGNVARKCRLGGMLMYSSGATVVRNNIISFNVIDSNCVDPDLGVVIGFDCRGNSGGHSIFGNQFIDSGVAGFAQEYGMKLDAPNCIVSGNTFDGTVVDCTFGSSATNTFIPPGTNYFVNNTQQFTAGASIAISKALGIASTDRVWEHRIWNATAGALRSLHAVDWAGKYWWGDGTNLEDTNLYRSAADTLKTDDAFIAGVSVTGDSTTSAQNGQFHAKNSNTNAFAAFRAYDSGGSAQFSFGYANSGTSSPFTSGAYISAASGTVTRFLTASVLSCEISSSRIWDFTNNPTVSGNAILNQTNTVASISNKSFSSPTLASGAISGTFTGNATFSGNLTLSGTNISSGLNTGSGTNSVTAFAGGGQASATALTKNTVFVTTVASAGDSVRLPTAALSISVVVYNLGANALDIFPVSGSAIDALGTNVAYSLAAGASRVFDGQTTTQWRSR